MTSTKWATRLSEIRRVLTANIEADKAGLAKVAAEDPLAHAVPADPARATPTR